MGIVYSNAALLALARRNNICFDKILTIGHQELHLSQKQLRQFAKCYGFKIDPGIFLREKYADKFFEIFLDAKSVTSLDYSDYQQANIVHDMNTPIDPSYHEKFDVVVDGGSLEHIFNFPVAVANCMKMVKKDGSLFIFTTANNHTGHGFYQFSPELFFRIFQSENGFATRYVILEKHPFPGVELSPRTRCFEVVDPASVKQRVGLVTNSPVMIMIHAIKTETKPVFADYPIQSDYLLEYNGDVNNAPVRRTNPAIYGLLKRVFWKCVSLLPSQCEKYITGRRQLSQFSFSNGHFYRRWYPS